VKGIVRDKIGEVNFLKVKFNKIRRSIVRWILSFASPRVATASRSEEIFIPMLDIQSFKCLNLTNLGEVFFV